MITNPRISNDLKVKLKAKKLKGVEIYSFFPIDKYGCDCQAEIRSWQNQFSQMSEKQRNAVKKRIDHITCPKSKQKGYKRYEVICKKCKETVAFVSAKDKYLTDWCDLHYYNRSNRERWFGCRTVNISPIDQKLGFECFCGNDTRDFRTSATLPPKEIEKRLRHRDFGLRSSTYKLKEV